MLLHKHILSVNLQDVPLSGLRRTRSHLFTVTLYFLIQWSNKLENLRTMPGALPLTGTEGSKVMTHTKQKGREKVSDGFCWVLQMKTRTKQLLQQPTVEKNKVAWLCSMIGCWRVT